MDNKTDISVPRTNRLAIVSLATGILALLLYLPDLILILGYLILGSSGSFEKMRDLVLPITLFSSMIYKPIGLLIVMASTGTIISAINLIVSNKAITQMRKGNNIEKGHGIAVTARVFGILGLIINIGFAIVILLSLNMQ